MGELTNVSDNHLVKLALRGDNKAYQALIKRYYSKISKIMYVNVNDHHMANDLTQEVLLKIVRYLSHFKDECEFYTWVYRIAQNTIKNHYRANQIRAGYENEMIYELAHDAYHSPEHHLMHLELTEQVEKNLQKLSEDLRECFGRFQFEGKSYELIAKEMNCPIGTVRSRIFRARKILTEAIQTKH